MAQGTILRITRPLLLGALALIFSAGTALAVTYGAMGYSQPTDTLTMEGQCPSQQVCEDDVLAMCRKQSRRPDACEVLLWYKNACGAFAKDSAGAYGSGWGDDENIAMKWAIKVCKDHGGKDCKSSTWQCSSGRAHLGG